MAGRLNKEISRVFAFLANGIFIILICSLILESNVPSLLVLNVQVWRNQQPTDNDTRDIEVRAISDLIQSQSLSFVAPDILYLHWKHGQPLPYAVAHPTLAFYTPEIYPKNSMEYVELSLGSIQDNVLSIFLQEPDLIVVRNSFSVELTETIRSLWEENIRACYSRVNNTRGVKLVELKAYRRKNDC